jgi:hypothetical protein
MGLFSTVYNQCQMLGDEFIGELQTKDLENALDSYWLSPGGDLFMLDWKDCFWMELNEKAEKWHEKIVYKTTGKKGRIIPYRRSFVGRFYPASIEEEWKEVYAFFRYGQLQEILNDYPLKY